MTPLDGTRWRRALEAGGLKPATVYARLSRLSSFFEWAMRDPFARAGDKEQSGHARPRPGAPRAYQTESPEALEDEQLRALMSVVR